jgi:hypothetical protein
VPNGQTNYPLYMGRLRWPVFVHTAAVSVWYVLVPVRPASLSFYKSNYESACDCSLQPADGTWRGTGWPLH